jgi:hypothetical protein
MGTDIPVSQMVQHMVILCGDLDLIVNNVNQPCFVYKKIQENRKSLPASQQEGKTPCIGSVVNAYFGQIHSRSWFLPGFNLRSTCPEFWFGKFTKLTP